MIADISRLALLETKTYRITYPPTICHLPLLFQLLSSLLSIPHLLPFPIQFCDLIFHFVPHPFPQRFNLRWYMSLLPCPLYESFLLPVPLRFDLHIPLVVAMRAEFRSGVLDLHHDFGSFATILEDVWGMIAGYAGSWGFGDRVATGANGLIDEAHDC